MSDHLSDETISELREELERERAELANKSKLALDELSRKHERGGQDTGDESSQEEATSKLLRLKDREKKYLTKINTALERMEDGVYGECVECGDEIPEKRLRARPAAVYCISCKEEREKDEERRKTRPGLMDDFSM